VSRGALAGALLLLLGACAATSPRGDLAARRIEDCRTKLEQHPRLYPVWAELGEALLDSARVSRAPAPLAEARAAFEQSLAIQPNFVAQRGMTALANFRHRFAEALTWAERAERAMPEDTSVLAMRVEALLSLGRTDEVRDWFGAHPPAVDDFHSRSAHARLLAALGAEEAAVEEFRAAAVVAAPLAPALAQWALIRAAAVHIDAGRAALAEPLLAEARAAAPPSLDLEVHTAEVEETLGRRAYALRRYERILERADDPIVHAAAARVAHELGHADRARFHAARARATFEEVRAAGEAYTLGAEARLDADLGTDLELALERARLHARTVVGPASDALVERIQALLAAR